MSRFFEGVRQAAEGTPYSVTETAEGFDVARDVVNEPAGRSGVFVHHVKWRGQGTFSVTDESRMSGTRRGRASLVVKRGRLIERGSGFDSEQGRHLITGVATELGLAQRRGTEERIALAAAAVAIGGLVLGGLVVAVLALLGVL